MSNLPQDVRKAWSERQAAVILTTVDKKGTPNSIYATCVSKFNDSTLVIADNYFNKTRQNILNGSRASILFITKSGKSYQIKGPVHYYSNGPIYKDMKQWNPEKHPGHAAVALTVEEVYCGAQKLI